MGEDWGQSPLATPYVAYYKFMCPTRQPVRRQLEKQLRELARLKGVAGVHLDYIRYPDVILPVALWQRPLRKNTGANWRRFIACGKIELQRVQSTSPASYYAS